MATPRVTYRYPSVARILCVVAAALVLLAAFGVHFPIVDIFELGVALFIFVFVI